VQLYCYCHQGQRIWCCYWYYCFPTSFCSICLVFFHKKYWLKRLFSSFVCLDRLEGSLDTYPYDCFFRGRYHSIAIDFLCLNHDTLCQYKKIELNVVTGFNTWFLTDVKIFIKSI
jgi:hypothetical protein